jgi:hypothetical protein
MPCTTAGFTRKNLELSSLSPAKLLSTNPIRMIGLGRDREVTTTLLNWLMASTVYTHYIQLLVTCPLFLPYLLSSSYHTLNLIVYSQIIMTRLSEHGRSFNKQLPRTWDNDDDDAENQDASVHYTCNLWESESVSTSVSPFWSISSIPSPLCLCDSVDSISPSVQLPGVFKY